MAETRGPPAFLLNGDLLSLVFSLNADIFANAGALRTTRLTSQVCRNWRDLLINSPVIWGRLLDLDALPQTSELWCNEVLRRSKQAPLTIKSDGALLRSVPLLQRSGLRIAPQEHFFFSLLDSEWSRIERLSVRIGSHITFPPDVLSSPAPQLRVFEVDAMSPVLLPQGQALFRDKASLLRVFRSRELSFKTSAAWLQNLRVIEIGAQIPISSVLDLLKQAHHLEELLYVGLFDEDVPYEYAPSSSLILAPIIRRLSICASVKACLYFIANIMPRHGYTLSLSASRYHPTTSLHNLSLYTERHFRVHIPTHVLLDLSNKFQFSSKDADSTSFTFRIFCAAASDDPLHILSALQIPTLTSVAVLNLMVTRPLRKRAIPQVAAFLRMIPNLKDLHIQASMCSYLIDVQEQSPDTLLPALDTLQVDAVLEEVFDFLRMRREIGHPISVLDLRQSERPGVLTLSLENLQKFTGLKILWE